MEAASCDADMLDAAVEVAAVGNASDAAVTYPVSQVSARPHVRGRSKKAGIPGAAVKPKKGLTPEQRTLESRKRANRRVNVRTKIAAAQLAQERVDALANTPRSRCARTPRPLQPKRRS
jgi:hypothetical protein